jgi:hypothetical protein
VYTHRGTLRLTRSRSHALRRPSLRRLHCAGRIPRCPRELTSGATRNPRKALTWKLSLHLNARWRGMN